jgi:ATP-GRASP peptide maturase of grasp-with-spasm system
MILILSARNDASTLNVLDWLMYYGKKFIILYTDDKDFKIIRFCHTQKEFIIKTKGKEVNLFDITTVWNRRQGISPFNFTNQYIDKKNPGDFFVEKGDTHHYYQLMEETKTLTEFIRYLVEKESVLSIGSFFSNNVNKLMVLDKAKQHGLDIPESYILTSKKDLKDLKNTLPDKYLITKAIYEGVYRPDVRNNYLYYSYVERLTKENIEQFPDNFYPSLVQVEIEKQLELRIFFIQEKFFPMAIFSQDVKAAETDFRRNDHANTPLKCVPYKIPKNLELKLLRLMRELNLNTGSIDVLLSKDGRYVFLEVNPCGQYGMTSNPCNYYLDKKIAQLLCKQTVLQ